MLVISSVVLVTLLLFTAAAVPLRPDHNGGSPQNDTRVALNARIPGVPHKHRLPLEATANPRSGLVKRAEKYIKMSLSVTGSTRYALIYVGNRHVPTRTFGPDGNPVRHDHQEFRMSFGTMTKRTFLPGLSCMENCRDRDPKYEPSLGNAHDMKVPFELTPTNNRGKVSGKLFSDTIEGVVQYIGVANSYSNDFRKEIFYPDGVLDISYQSASYLNRMDSGLNSFLWGLKKAGKITSAEVTLKPIELSVRGRAASQLILGSAGPKLPPISSVNVVQNHGGYWRIPCRLSIDRVEVSGKEIILNTGLPWAEVRPDVTDRIYRSMGSQARRQPDGRYIIPCGIEFPAVSLNVGSERNGRQLAPRWERFSIKPPNDPRLGKDQCYGAFVASDLETTIIGDAILGQFEVTLDLEGGTVSFA